VIGSIQRECLDRVIPLSEAHLRSILHTGTSGSTGARLEA